jgi:hypothetical protein
MPWEYIGECGSGDMPEDQEWIDYCLEAGMNYLRFVLGEPPDGCELGIMMNDHELGNYPSIGVYWSFPADGPWEYISRADDLLSTYNHSIEWEKIHEMAMGTRNNVNEQLDMEAKVADTSFENPSSTSMTFYTYKGEHFRCKHCGWNGMGGELVFGEEFDQLVELNCPACQTKVSFVMYPTLAESRANWERLSDSEKAQVEQIENAQARFNALCLKSPEQLPQIDGLFFPLVWDFDGDDDMTLLRFGDAVIFSEPAVYEGYERFEEVTRILKARYGNALQDVVPSPASETYLYGDSLTASERVEKFRLEIFRS